MPNLLEKKRLVTHFKSLTTRSGVIFSTLLLLFLVSVSVVGVNYLSPGVWQQLTNTLTGQSAPQPVALTPKMGSVGYQRQKIAAATGGKVTTDQVTVELPANFTDQDVVVAYRTLATQKLAANHAVGGMFELTAKKVDGNQQVTQFNQPLSISIALSEEQEKEVTTSKLQLYFFNEQNKTWEALSSRYDKSTNTLVATTTHFTVFLAADGNPNQGITQSTAADFIVDDGDQEPAFIPDGLTDDDQPAFWEQVGSGYNGNALYTGNSINDTPHNWATWNVTGLTGEVEVFVTIPDVKSKALTKRATYKVTHAGGTTAVEVDQEAHRGGSASLGTFTFDGSGSVYLNDVVVEKGDFFLSHIVFDAVSFGEDLSNLDIIGPDVTDVRAFSDSGMFRISALVTDIGSGVGEVYLIMNGVAYPMVSMGGDRYALDLPVGRNAKLNYSIVAYDKVGNEGGWIPGYGQVSRGAFYRLTGYAPGTIKTADSNCNTCPGQDTTSTQIVGHPINTVNGNLIEEVSLVEVGGRPAFTFGLTYNNQAGRPSIFGENWTHTYNYHALAIETPESNAVHVQYPDGQVVTFTGDNLEPQPGHFEKLERDGTGFTLTFTDLSQATFDADGDLTRWQDANGNGLTFSYGAKQPHTLVSNLQTITADSGRTLTFTTNELGLVTSMTAPENKSFTFTYSDEGDLLTWTNARGGVTTYTYDDHNMTQATTPEGFVYMTNTFDSDRRVVEHHVGENYHLSFAYTDDQTTTTDANGHQVEYQFNDKELLTTITDQTGNSASYTFTDERQLKSRTDEEGAITSYEYDAKGNVTKITDPLDGVITRTFDQTFNKPLSEVNKLADHTTAWTYDSKGNVLSETDALGSTRTFTYDQYGQLLTESNFRGNTTTYSYSPPGDRVTTIDPENNTTQFSYDGIGRLITLTNPRGFVTTYSYDGNDNLTKLQGPDSYTLSYSYDANDRLTSETDANGGTTTYTYDTSNNLLTKVNQLGFTTNFEYGLMNELLKTT
jgi:YD repeat-containing protein